VQLEGERSGLYGAKITGGGSGGTVCVLGAAGKEAEAALARVLHAYERETGRQAYVVQGSSQGALEFGHVRLRPVK
jgi:L-arabinokinase